MSRAGCRDRQVVSSVGSLKFSPQGITAAVQLPCRSSPTAGRSATTSPLLGGLPLLKSLFVPWAFSRPDSSLTEQPPQGHGRGIRVKPNAIQMPAISRGSDAPTGDKNRQSFVTLGWKWSAQSSRNLRVLSMALGFESLGELGQRALEMYLTAPEVQQQLSAVDSVRRTIVADLEDALEGRL